MSAIRPLSHKLWEPNVTDGGIRRFMSALQWGARAVSINPYIILFVYFATAIAPYFREGALIINIERLSIHMIMLYLTLLALEWVLKHGGRRILQVKTASILVFALIYEVVTATLSNVILNHDDKASAVVFDYLWLVFLIFSTSGLISIFTREEEFLDSLKSLLTESELKFASQKMAMSGQSQELARYIHSNIQSALINSANLIEQATEIGDEAAIRREVDRIQSILHLPDLQQLDQSANSLSLAIRRTKANWDGLMSIKTKVSGEKNNASPGEIKKLEAVLDEGLSNAFRHGQANNVNIELQATDEELRLTVSDDGVGPTGGQEGMGSQTFDTIAGSSWSLDRSEKGGAVLTLRIARTHNG